MARLTRAIVCATSSSTIKCTECIIFTILKAGNFRVQRLPEPRSKCASRFKRRREQTIRAPSKEQRKKVGRERGCKLVRRLQGGVEDAKRLERRGWNYDAQGTIQDMVPYLVKLQEMRALFGVSLVHSRRHAYVPLLRRWRGSRNQDDSKTIERLIAPLLDDRMTANR